MALLMAVRRIFCYRHARTRLLSVMIFPLDDVLSWLGPRTAAGSG